MNGRASERTNDEDDGAAIFWMDERSDDMLGFSHYSSCTPLTDRHDNLFNSSAVNRLRTLRT